MPFIHVDPNTLKLKISSDMDDPYVPTEETIAIKMFAQELQKFRDDFVKNQFNPRVDKLMQMVLEYNAKTSPELAEQLKAMQERKKEELREQMEREDPKPKKSAKKTPKKAPQKAAPKKSSKQSRSRKSKSR